VNGQHRIHLFAPYVNKQAVRNVTEVLTQPGPDGRLWIGEGPRVKELEQKAGRMVEAYVTATNSGTAALHLALVMCGVRAGDEVITPSYTCSATNMPILMQQAVPVFADVQYGTGNIDPLDIEHRITPKTKAIMVVHWGGMPVDLDQVNHVADRYDLPVVEDAAHAFGAVYRGRPIGSISRFTMFSLQAIKQITAGDGGLLCTKTMVDRRESVQRRWFGIDRKARITRPSDHYPYWNQTLVGFKYHLNDIGAAIALGNLEDYDTIMAVRKAQADRYDRELTGVPGVTLFDRPTDRTSAWWLYTMHVENRLGFLAALEAENIDASCVHIRNDEHDAFGGLRNDLPNTTRYAATNVSLPIGMHVTPEDQGRVIETITRGW